MQFTPNELTAEQMLSLRDFPRQVPDPRGRRGQRYLWPALMTIMLAVRIAGATTLTDISDFGRALEQRCIPLCFVENCQNRP